MLVSAVRNTARSLFVSVYSAKHDAVSMLVSTVRNTACSLYVSVYSA